MLSVDYTSHICDTPQDGLAVTYPQSYICGISFLSFVDCYHLVCKLFERFFFGIRSFGKVFLMSHDGIVGVLSCLLVEVFVAYTLLRSEVPT